MASLRAKKSVCNTKCVSASNLALAKKIVKFGTAIAMSVAETANTAKVSVKENPRKSFFITVTFATN
jgi:hypothetical protein